MVHYDISDAERRQWAGLRSPDKHEEATLVPLDGGFDLATIDGEGSEAWERNIREYNTVFHPFY